MNIDTSNLLNSILEELSSLSYVHPGDVPNINLYMDQVTTFMDEQLAMLQLENSAVKKQQIWVPYASVSKSLKRALIAAEDAKFLDHDGFDWDGIENAWEKNLAKGKIVAGGSTISQQLAKNLFLSANKTPWRKLDEAIITVMLETILDKQRIFELYLNVIEWGDGIFGAEAAGGAGRHYLGATPRVGLSDLVGWAACVAQRISGSHLPARFRLQIPRQLCIVGPPTDRPHC